MSKENFIIEIIIIDKVVLIFNRGGKVVILLNKNIDQRQGSSNVEQRQFRNVQRAENKCYICHENDHLTESCSRFNEFETWRKGMAISASGNEFAPPMPGIGRSLEQ